MKYVVDCSTAFKWFVIETDRPKAIRLRDEFEKGNIALLAPDLFPIEIANSLLMAEQGRNPRLAAGQAALFLNHLLQKPPTLLDSVPILPRAQEIAKQYKRSVYDCLYVALAEREQCDLVTADVKLEQLTFWCAGYFR
ncbi:MAG TPA: type II toxin-antitoxin system VapC family toxin [Gemmataceae bacterium]|nr:type II toxin-antitoxin system VapC family toxin [Gemmataceae bacterium]